MATSSLRAFPPVACVLLGLASLSSGTSLAQVLPATATERFETLDTNQDGLVAKDEYESGNLFSQLDGDRNNRITADELEAILGPQEDGAPSAADRIRLADANGDDELSDEELRRNAEMQFTWLDRDNDGYLDLAEMKSGFGIPAVP